MDVKQSLHTKILPGNQLKLFEELSSNSFIKDFYLAGGTCLALQIGHRQSIDFDFFIPDDFDTAAIINRLTQIGTYQRSHEEYNTINGILNGVRVSFFGYKYPMVDDFLIYRHMRLAGPRDLAAMKLEAIAGRGSKKDFIDLYFLLQQFQLREIFTFHTQKYGTGLSNQYHLLKSLIYFEDAEDEVMPVMREPLQWTDAKKLIINQAKRFQL